MLVEIDYYRKEKKADVNIIYHVTMFEEGIEHTINRKVSHTNCDIAHTGESITFVDTAAPNEVEISSSYIKGIYPKALTIVNFVE